MRNKGKLTNMKLFNKILNIIGLILWIHCVIWAGICIVTGIMISPWAYLSAALVCMLFYLEEVIKDFINLD